MPNLCEKSLIRELIWEYLLSEDSKLNYKEESSRYEDKNEIILVGVYGPNNLHIQLKNKSQRNSSYCRRKLEVVA